MAEDEKQPEEVSEGLNIIEEEKAQERGELDYNSIFDDDYVEENKPQQETSEVGEAKPEVVVEHQKEKKTKDKSKKFSKKPQKEEKPAKKMGKNQEEKNENIQEVISQEPAKQIVKNKGSLLKKTLAILAILFALLIGVFAGYLYFNKTKKSHDNSQPTVSTKPETKLVQKDVYVTANDGLNMREDPSSSSKSLAVIPYGTKLSVMDSQSGWDKVDYQGQQGWISADYVSETKPVDWKTYTGTGQMANNPQFSIKYPSDWALDGYKVSKTDNGLMYTVAFGEGGHGFSEGDTSITSSQENITVNGFSGTKTTATKNGKIISLVTTFLKGNSYINIEFEPPAGYDQSYIDIYNKMVNTFKFF